MNGKKMNVSTITTKPDCSLVIPANNSLLEAHDSKFHDEIIDYFSQDPRQVRIPMDDDEDIEFEMMESVGLNIKSDTTEPPVVCTDENQEVQKQPHYSRITPQLFSKQDTSTVDVPESALENGKQRRLNSKKSYMNLDE
jgi:hypothetical protein